MLERNAAEGIHRVEDAHVNWYLVEEAGRLIVVDAGLPRSWGSLQSALATLHRVAGDIDAIVLTHAHFDHIGFARRAQTELGVPVWAHDRERSLVRHPWRYDDEATRVRYLRHPGFVKVFTEMTAMGALWVRGTESVNAYQAGNRLDVPARPLVIFFCV